MIFGRSICALVLVIISSNSIFFVTKVISTHNLVMASTIPSAKYTALIRQLYKVNIMNPVKMGLENTMKLYDLLDRPMSNVPIVHVAGTNGKGSVSLKTAECLSRSGLRTGLFVSPHIASFRERVQVDGKILDEDDIQVRMAVFLCCIC